MPKPTAKELAQSHSDWIPAAARTLIEARGVALAEIFSELGPEIIEVVKEPGKEPVFIVLIDEHSTEEAA